MSHAWCRAAAWSILLVMATGVAARPVFASEASHVRIFDENLTTLVSRGMERSATFRSLVRQIDGSALLVFVQCHSRHESASSAAGLAFLASAAGYRYVRAFIRCDLPASVQLPLIAHEFQHSLEVAASPDVVDAKSMQQHYEQIGYRSSGDDRHRSYETDAALETQRRVTLELTRTPLDTLHASAESSDRDFGNRGLEVASWKLEVSK